MRGALVAAGSVAGTRANDEACARAECGETRQSANNQTIRGKKRKEFMAEVIRLTGLDGVLGEN